MNWIKVSERLPELYTYVLVLADNKGTGEPKPISIAKLYTHKGNWEFCNKAPLMPNYGAWQNIEYPMDDEDITHWAALPEAPRVCKYCSNFYEVNLSGNVCDICYPKCVNNKPINAKPRNDRI